VARRLMLLAPDASEGRLSATRAQLINADALAERADALGLEPALRCGRGELKMGPAARAARLADAFEAVAGALFADRGLDPADEWVWGALRPLYEALGEQVASAKNRLQERAHAHRRGAPRYALLPPAAGEPLVAVEVWLDGERLASARAPTRKAAEEAAALAALDALPP